MKKKVSLFMALLLVVCGFASCSNNEKVTPETKEMYKPVWLGNTVYEESVVLIEDEKGVKSGKLLYAPTEILRVNNYTLEKTFDKSEYQTDGNKFIATGTSTMPFFTAKQYNEADITGLIELEQYEAKEQGKKILFTESAGLVKYHVNVTYKHSDTWEGVSPKFNGTKLSRSINKLEQGKELNFFMTGDSIAAGANSSSNLNIEPRRPSFGTGIMLELEDWYGADVDFNNGSVGGWLSADGKNNIDKQMAEYAPDLAIIAFGMNDGSHQVSASNYESNIRDIIESIREASPTCDIILIATILANPIAPQDRIQKTYLPNLNAIAADTENCVVVDMTSFTEEMYKNKRGIDFLSNNINHPSDFLMRIYTMNLMSAICKGYL